MEIVCVAIFYIYWRSLAVNGASISKGGGNRLTALFV